MDRVVASVADLAALAGMQNRYAGEVRCESANRSVEHVPDNPKGRHSRKSLADPRDAHVMEKW